LVDRIILNNPFIISLRRLEAIDDRRDSQVQDEHNYKDLEREEENIRQAGSAPLNPLALNLIVTLVASAVVLISELVHISIPVLAGGEPQENKHSP